MNLTLSFAAGLLLAGSPLAAEPTPVEEIWLPGEYAYYAGDSVSTDWMSPDFDDSAWPGMRLGAFPHAQFNGEGWFRAEVKIRSVQSEVETGFLITLRGGAEVWVDGRFLGRFGVFSNRPHSHRGSIAFAHPPYQNLTTISFQREPADSASISRHIVAIRYSNAAFSAPEWENFRPEFSFEIGSLAKMHARQSAFVRKVTTNQYALMSVCLAFALLHFLLWLFYARMRANLYYAIITVLAAVNIFFEFQPNLISDPGAILWAKRLDKFSFIFFALACLRFMYAVNYAKRPRQFFLFAAVGVGLSIWAWFRPFAVDQPFFIYFLVIIAEVGRAFISMRGRKKQIEGSWIIGIGASLLVAGALYNILGSFGLFPLLSFIDFPTPYYGMLGFMISMSFFLARHFATTSRNLEAKLVEVKALSEKNLQQGLERARLEAENARKTQELEEARRIQQSMLPQTLPILPELEIAVYMRPATEVGGDYYDFKLHDDGSLTAAIGDATGHGMQAGAMVSATKGLFTAVADDPEPVRILKRGTKALKSMGLHRMFMALTIAKFRGREVNIAAAGMPYPLVWRAESGKVEEVELKGMPLGGFDDFPYQGKKLRLDPGDTILFMSDGLPEMFNPRSELFGEERVKDLFAAIAPKSPEEIIESLREAGEHWADGRSQEDDVTFVVIKVKRS